MEVCLAHLQTGSVPLPAELAKPLKANFKVRFAIVSLAAVALIVGMIWIGVGVFGLLSFLQCGVVRVQ